MLYFPSIKDNENQVHSFKKYIDFDKSDKIFYDNLYLGEYKIVIKIPLTENNRSQDTIKIEEFSLENDTFLTSY